MLEAGERIVCWIALVQLDLNRARSYHGASEHGSGSLAGRTTRPSKFTFLFPSQ